ncbi:drug/metabolite transporter (DMT)-like permease [Arthrobacter pascens]|nr:drug/metabolite transporter (DMT)-like permease [Arthrobacter pascens]
MNFLLAAFGVLGVASSGPLIAATLGATTVSALAIAFWRNAIAAGVMASPILIREPREFGRITRREFRWSLLAAVALALHFACFITSLQLTSVAAATALVCLQSAWIAVFQLLRGTRHRWQVLAGLGIAFGGVVAITGFDMGSTPGALLGDLLAVAGGALAGLYTLAGGRARQSMSLGDVHHALLRDVRGPGGVAGAVQRPAAGRVRRRRLAGHCSHHRLCPAGGPYGF